MPPRLPLPCQGGLPLAVAWQLLAVALHPTSGGGCRLLLPPIKSMPLPCLVLLSGVRQPLLPWKGLLLLGAGPALLHGRAAAA